MSPVVIYGQSIPEALIWVATIFRILGALLLLSHVLPCQIAELRCKGGYKTLKIALLVFTLVLLVANLAPTFTLLCTYHPFCSAGRIDDITFPLGGLGSFMASLILLLIYKGKYKR